MTDITPKPKHTHPVGKLASGTKGNIRRVKLVET